MTEDTVMILENTWNGSGKQKENAAGMMSGVMMMNAKKLTNEELAAVLRVMMVTGICPSPSEKEFLEEAAERLLEVDDYRKLNKRLNQLSEIAKEHFRKTDSTSEGWEDRLDLFEEGRGDLQQALKGSAQELKGAKEFYIAMATWAQGDKALPFDEWLMKQVGVEE